MLSFSYKGLCDLLSTIPSLTDPAKTVMQEIDEFNAMPRNKTHANARLVVRGADGPQIVDAKHLQLGARDRFDLALMAMGPEKRLGTRSIKDCFQERFFQTNFWLMWATM
jgi:oleate hydratase